MAEKTAENVSEDRGKYSTEVSSDFVKFGEPVEGDDSTFVSGISGILISKDSVQMQGKDVGKYKIEVEGGGEVAFLGSVLLDDKLELIEIGTDILIEMTGLKKSTTAGHSPTKQFRVFVAE